MTINAPTSAQIPALRKLWKQAFGDTDAFLDDFFRLAFSPDRCRCIMEEGRLAAMLYWFDCRCAGQKVAYLYAVATDKAFQNRGLCRALMTDTQRQLQQAGYHSAMLVPGSRELFRFYEKLGYRTATHVREFTCAPGADPISLRKISPQEYALLGRQLLPAAGVIQEGAALALLEAQGGFFAGDGFLLAGTLTEGKLLWGELLGSADAAPGILSALGAAEGRFRMPGSETAFAMHLSLSPDAIVPTYFGLALD